MTSLSATMRMHATHPTMGAALSRAIFRKLRWLGLLLLLCCCLLATPAMAATSANCAPATTRGTAPIDYATYCWFDFKDYSDTLARGAAGQAFVFTFPGGATVSFTLNVSSPSGYSSSLVGSASPSWSGAAFGNSGFNGIPGKPVLYQANNGTTVTINFSNIVLSTNGATNFPYALVAADGESTNDGETLSFTTGGNAWTQLAAISNGSQYPAVSGLTSRTVLLTGIAGTVGSYAFATNGSPPSMSATMKGSGLQGAIFGVKFYASDLTVKKSHTGDFIAGGTGNYKLVVHNNGPVDAQGVTTVTDVLPAGLTYVSAIGTGWSCSAVAQIVTCTNPNVIANGADLPAITLKVNVAIDAPATINNTATVSNPYYDFDTSNSSSTDPTKIVGPNLLVMKSVTAISDPVEGTAKPKSLPGAVMQYQITVSNNGSGQADNNSLVITDPIPANTKFVLNSLVFTPGSSGLTSASVTYFNSSNASIMPADDGSGADPNVTKLQIAPQGTMAAKAGTTAPAPSFSVVFKVIIK